MNELKSEKIYDIFMIGKCIHNSAENSLVALFSDYMIAKKFLKEIAKEDKENIYFIQPQMVNFYNNINVEKGE